MIAPTSNRSPCSTRYDPMSVTMEETQSIGLYDWQHEAVDVMRRNIRAGMKNQLLAAPTGSGKTRISAFLIDECRRKGKRAYFICDRISLIDQTSATFDELGIPHGVIQAQHWRWRPWERVQVASAQTLARRKMPEDLDLIIVDEAHTIMKAIADRIMPRECITIGLTATPFSKGLGKLYDEVVNVRTLNQLTADGYLSPYIVYAASEPDMTGAKVVAGEWQEKEAASRSMAIVGDCVAEYVKHAQGQKFICFGVNVAHCEELQKQFMAAGVQTGLYTYRTGEEERRRMVEEFRQRDGYLTGLISVSALAKGFDVPSVECVILARPLRSSLAEHIQMVGRGLRRDPANPDKVCTILDHSGNMVRFWWAMHDFFENGADELDDGKRKDKKKEKERKEPDPSKCPKCHHVHLPRPACPRCGHEYPRKSRIEHIPGELRALASSSPENVRDLRQDVYSQLLWVAKERAWKDGWAAHKFREMFGSWPDGLSATARQPTGKTRRWVQAQMIRWAKSQQGAA